MRCLVMFITAVCLIFLATNISTFKFTINWNPFIGAKNWAKQLTGLDIAAKLPGSLLWLLLVPRLSSLSQPKFLEPEEIGTEMAFDLD